MQIHHGLCFLAIGAAISHTTLASPTWIDAITDGKALIDLRLRYEQHDSDNNNDTADALTLRSRLGFQTAPLAGFQFLYEIDDVRALIDDYAPEQAGYDVVADPVNTEINRAQLSYQNEQLNAVLGRQRLVWDNARFIGNVGWRQNEQTYDAIKIGYQHADWQWQYAYINQVNGITFNDIDVNHHLLHAKFSGLKAGNITAYAYLLDDKDSDTTHNTAGAFWQGNWTNDTLPLQYRLELAQQSAELANGNEFTTYYYLAEGSVNLSGIRTSVGYEVLSSDGGDYGFQTPLATKHAFNGWADKFLNTPATGLHDRYVKVGGQAMGARWLLAYHDYASDQGSVDQGNEFNGLVSYALEKNTSLGAKLAVYQAGDVGVDTTKFWLWAEYKY
ncbi:MAG: alginate export family protein [Bacterioplanes sp.]|nr:alginate export family protein [Bacterioplanes sp.]